eukprot:scaffold110054_cov22-Tisochrysis_lutea.AAC.1
MLNFLLSYEGRRNQTLRCLLWHVNSFSAALFTKVLTALVLMSGADVQGLWEGHARLQLYGSEMKRSRGKNRWKSGGT